jgi:3'-5' exoribonuclease 1
MAILVDFEATCWDKDEKHKQGNAEIIEIGAVAVDGEYQVLSEFSTFIRPVKEPVLSEFCRSLTGIEQREVDKALKFNDGIQCFYHWILTSRTERDYAIYTWGNYDRSLLRRNFRMNKCKNGGMSNIIHGKMIDLQEIFLKTVTLQYSSCSMSMALSIIGECFQGKKHSSLDDARNLLKLYRFLYETNSKKNSYWFNVKQN